MNATRDVRSVREETLGPMCFYTGPFLRHYVHDALVIPELNLYRGEHPKPTRQIFEEHVSTCPMCNSRICAEVQPLLPAFVSDEPEISAKQHGVIETHVQGCASCSAEVERLQSEIPRENPINEKTPQLAAV